MKLDRNINPDGKGKYALINLRTNQVQWGGEDQFFVIKYKDEFTASALRGYADAIKRKIALLLGRSITGLPPNMDNPLPVEVAKYRAEMARKAEDLNEYCDEILKEAEAAENWPNKKQPD